LNNNYYPPIQSCIAELWRRHGLSARGGKIVRDSFREWVDAVSAA
jgi:hypothetical protein